MHAAPPQIAVENRVFVLDFVANARSFALYVGLFPRCSAGRADGRRGWFGPVNVTTDMSVTALVLAALVVVIALASRRRRLGPPFYKRPAAALLVIVLLIVLALCLFLATRHGG